jgi:transcriptional regulator with XRE-family HTH domain
MFYPKDKGFSRAEEKAYAREELVYNVTEDLLVLLEDLDISKKELARRLGKSKSYVTQVLSGARNMTLGTLSDICFVLGFKPEVKLPVGDGSMHISKHKAQWQNVIQNNQFTAKTKSNVISFEDHKKNYTSNYEIACNA